MNNPPSRLRGVRAFTGQTSLACAVAVACAGISVAGSVHAAGFQLVEHGASGMGNAYAGAAALASDTSTAWYNPAGMSELGDREISLAAHLLIATTEFTNRGTTQGSALGSGDISGPDSASPGTNTVLPNLYYVAPINAKWNYGLSIGVPFGSSTEYEPEWVGRYTTVKSGISVIDVNPSVSYRLSDTVRLGFGISVQQLSAELGSAVDSGAACLSVYNRAGSPETCFENGLTPGNVENDGYGEITGDSTGVGFNLGALFLPGESTRIGLTFRSGVSHELDGDADFDTNETLRGLLDDVGQDTFLIDTNATADVDLPPTVSLSAVQQVGSALELLADISWTGWSSFEELRVNYEAPSTQGDTLSVQEWNDTLRLSAGLNYDLNDQVQLRGGVAYDEEAIPGPSRRTARIPGNDRTWIALGAGFRVNPRLSFDLAYSHLFLETTAIDNPNLEANDGVGGPVVRGTYESSVDFFSAQLNWQFN